MWALTNTFGRNASWATRRESKVEVDASAGRTSSMAHDVSVPPVHAKTLPTVSLNAQAIAGFPRSARSGTYQRFTPDWAYGPGEPAQYTADVSHNDFH